ncbi:peptidoglycan-recognition protein 2-like isoform X2 [Frankliniella occidentalis]|uniref:Peptidoglycan-recognition protein n=1 Tax=Frankliniella occidentalis TaxID=133901 RepID=A0A9C6WT53_FRAOC|nr:peptidoglycan-recognition protein 2-like isoform X2 [Frankliniella occidentalis]
MHCRRDVACLPGAMRAVRRLACIYKLNLAAPGARGACPDIIPRRRWGAASSERVDYIPFPVRDVIVGHTVGGSCASEEACAQEAVSIQKQHKALGWGDIGYGFLIGGDGLIFEGQGWHKEGAHTYGYNKKSIGVAFMGDFSERRASTAQLKALRALLRCGVELGELSEDVRLYGQRQVQQTESPGRELYKQIKELPEWVAAP